ncbi:MAG: CheY-like chemotaxis protein [Kiritimatiellia bacterium]|jgi:CheY-like chemotaxis protein
MRILIVDDSRAMQTIVRRGIEQLGYDQLELKKANDGQEALDIVRVWEPDLVISDWHMPEMTGLELLKALTREMLDIKIGFVTTENSEKRIKEALDAGAVFIVQKPFDAKTLHEAVLPIIQGSTEGENALREQEQDQKVTTTLSEHIQLPHINTLKDTLNALSKSPLDIQASHAMQLNKKHYPYLLGLYSDKDKKSVHAIAIADINAACILGALSGKISEELVHITLAKKAIPKGIMDNCQAVLRTLETTLKNTQKGHHLSLRSSNIMRKQNFNVEKLLRKNSENRLDIRITMENFGSGCLTLIVS